MHLLADVLSVKKFKILVWGPKYVKVIEMKTGDVNRVVSGSFGEAGGSGDCVSLACQAGGGGAVTDRLGRKKQR